MATKTTARPAVNGTSGKQVGETTAIVAEVARELAYETGYQHALTLAAERVDELDAVWRAVPRPTYEQRVAARVVEMERHAARLATDLLDKHGRAPWTYRGGPVDWETGRPVRRLEVAA